MKFQNEADRLKHPQAGLIPRSLWTHYYFGESLDETLIPLMTAPSNNELIKRLNSFSSMARPQQKHCAWMAICFSNPNLSAEKLYLIGRLLNINPKELFAHAACVGKLEVMQYLGLIEPQQLKIMIEEENFEAFKWAAFSGHVEVLRFIVQNSPNQLQSMIAAQHFIAFRLAAQNGHVTVLRYLKQKVSVVQLQHMIEAERFFAFRSAASQGHLKMLKYLKQNAPHQLQIMIKADDFFAFREAAKNGHLEVLLYLGKEVPQNLPIMITEYNFFALRMSASHGYLDVFRYLEQYVTIEQLQQSIEAERFFAFRYAVSNGHLAILHYLEQKTTPQRLQQSIEAERFFAFKHAAAHGHLEVLKYIEQKAKPELLELMITAEGFIAFSDAAKKRQHSPVAEHLLNHPSVFAQTEAHIEEYLTQYIRPFVQQKLTELRDQKEHFALDHPNGVFDVQNPKESRLYFYFLRHLIRNQHFDTVRDEFLLLLDLPSVKALAPIEVTQGQSNELIRLALSCGNQSAAALLLCIPQVHALAEAHGFYRQEQQGGLDLAQLAQDRESSMSALTQGEQERLKSLIANYNPLLLAAGVPNIIKQLYQELQTRYEEQPATIVCHPPITNENTILKLPCFWNEFKNIPLRNGDKERALKAYYQHPVHTALRYISKPNYWMHQEASYICINEEKTNRWSTFEEYQPLIALLYLGAIDESIGEHNGYNQDSRLDLFIKELALIGRAHNWDNTRIKKDTFGNTMYNAQGVEIKEEFDDGEGDRPSCFSGVKRRLFQSLPGHPLMMMLTADLIKQELNEYMRQHFQDRITQANQSLIKNAWDKLIIASCLSDEEYLAVKQLNATKAEKIRFLSKLSDKYGEQFTKDPSFNNYIETMLHVDTLHLTTFGYLHPEQFIEMPLSPQVHFSNLLQQHGVFSLFQEGSDELPSESQDQQLLL